MGDDIIDTGGNSLSVITNLLLDRLGRFGKEGTTAASCGSFVVGW